MPSELYGTFATGTPLVAIACDNCELADTVQRHLVGATAPRGARESIASAILELASAPEQLELMG
jgi:hypothetical protein